MSTLGDGSWDLWFATERVFGGDDGMEGYAHGGFGRETVRGGGGAVVEGAMEAGTVLCTLEKELGIIPKEWLKYTKSRYA